MLRQTKHHLTRSKRLLLEIINYQELNIEDGNSSIGLKAEVSLPLM